MLQFNIVFNPKSKFLSLLAIKICRKINEKSASLFWFGSHWLKSSTIMALTSEPNISSLLTSFICPSPADPVPHAVRVINSQSHVYARAPYVYVSLSHLTDLSYLPFFFFFMFLFLFFCISRGDLDSSPRRIFSRFDTNAVCSLCCQRLLYSH